MLFWHNIDGDTKLPYCIEKAVNSITVAGYYEVHMVSYQKFTNVPNFVIQVDAEIVMPKDRPIDEPRMMGDFRMIHHTDLPIILRIRMMRVLRADFVLKALFCPIILVIIL